MSDYILRKQGLQIFLGSVVKDGSFCLHIKYEKWTKLAQIKKDFILLYDKCGEQQLQTLVQQLTISGHEVGISVDSASFPYKMGNEVTPQAQSRKMEKNKGKEEVV